MIARIVGSLLYVWAGALFAGLAWVAWIGHHYWPLDAIGRRQHPLDAALAPGSGGGVLLGIIGTTLMTAMLAYTLRKKWVSATWLGPVPLWLRFHVICGVTGPLFILLHSGLRWPTGLIAVGFWCMVLVALSGVFGRYVYGFLPRLANGRAMAWDDAMASLVALRADLVTATIGARPEPIGAALALAQGLDVDARGLFDLVRLDREVRRRRRDIRSLLDDAGLPEESRSLAEGVLDEQLRLRRGVEASRAAYRLFRYWHLFHRPLASAMYVVVALHVLSAVLFGDSLGRVAALFGE